MDHHTGAKWFIREAEHLKDDQMFIMKQLCRIPFVQLLLDDIMEIHCKCWTQYDFHDDVIKWKHFPRYWPFVHRSLVNSPHKGQWRGALMFSLICAWINGWVNTGEAGVLRRHFAHNDVIVMDVRLFEGGVYLRTDISHLNSIVIRSS